MMPKVRDRLDRHVSVLVEHIGARPPGSPANRAATAYVRDVLTASGAAVTDHPFVTRWWEPGPGRLESRHGTEVVQPNPYSPAADVEGYVEVVDTVQALEGLTPASDRVLVLRDELAREQLMPAGFPFLQPPEHVRIRLELQRLAPRAIVALTDHHEPILEDPELAIPSTTVALRLSRHLEAGASVRLTTWGTVHAGVGSTVSGSFGAGQDRIVLSAHLDSKATTPGAIDNAAGVAVLLALAETLTEVDVPIEVVLFNGEDHFDACGELAWIEGSDLAQVVGNVNLDGVGASGRATSLANLSCPTILAERLTAWLRGQPNWVPADPWFQSDHAIFAMRGIPALAVTSEGVFDLLPDLIHTSRDTLEVVDLTVLEDIVTALPSLITEVASLRRRESRP
jgi:aminopeptidase YwaD